jgi:hypothetical protein
MSTARITSADDKTTINVDNGALFYSGKVDDLTPTEGQAARSALGLRLAKDSSTEPKNLNDLVYLLRLQGVDIVDKDGKILEGDVTAEAPAKAAPAKAASKPVDRSNT